MKPDAALDEGLAALEIELPSGARAGLLGYLGLLSKWNRTYNLTAIRDPLAMVSHHLLDSLAVLPHLPMPEADPSLADAGSGAGLPGIPLALARPDWQVWLAESSGKKAAFLRQAAMELRLHNVSVYEGRVETWQPASRFAVVISRAFSELRKFVVACRHLVAEGGLLAAMKSTRAQEEVRGLDAHCRAVGLRVPLLNAERCLVLCRP